MDEYVSHDGTVFAVTVRPAPIERPRRRRVLLPAVLFVLTCLSTLYAGGARTVPLADGGMAWEFDARYGLTYMVAVMAILLAHEMGHFLQAWRHGIPASWPYFIPMPFTPLGTMGAVIGMQGSQADRKQLFDIGLTGPLAGLAVLLPIAWYGIRIAQPIVVPDEAVVFHDPLLFQSESLVSTTGFEARNACLSAFNTGTAQTFPLRPTCFRRHSVPRPAFRTREPAAGSPTAQCGRE